MMLVHQLLHILRILAYADIWNKFPQFEYPFHTPDGGQIDASGYKRTQVSFREGCPKEQLRSRQATDISEQILVNTGDLNHTRPEDGLKKTLGIVFRAVLSQTLKVCQFECYFLELYLI